MLVLGAGGAARAVAVELALAGVAHLTIGNRSVEKAARIARLVADRCGVGAEAVAWEGELGVPEDVTAVVNATSLGLPGSGAVPLGGEAGPHRGRRARHVRLVAGRRGRRRPARQPCHRAVIAPAQPG